MKEITEDKGRVRPVVEGDFQCDENGNSTKFYEILSIVGQVNDDGTKISYISKTNVPIGIPLTDTEYWYPFQVIAVPKGDKGDKGEDGKSAYDLYIEHGGTITPVEAWLESLQGKDGKDGNTPIIKISDNGMDILISSDNGETWYKLVPDFTKLRILGYVDSLSKLPRSADIGDIYGVWNADAQEGQGAYELYINLVTGWNLDGNITKVYEYETELPASAADGTVAIIPQKGLTLDKEKIDGYKVYKYSLAQRGWIMILNTSEIFVSKEDIINHGDNLYALVQGDIQRIPLTITNWINGTLDAEESYTEDETSIIGTCSIEGTIETLKYNIAQGYTVDIRILSDNQFDPSEIASPNVLIGTEGPVQGSGEINIPSTAKSIIAIIKKVESEETLPVSAGNYLSLYNEVVTVYELYARQVEWQFFGTNGSITYHLIQNIQEGTDQNILSGLAIKDAINVISKGTNMVFTASPSVIYKNVATQVTLTATMRKSVPTNIKILDGNTVIAEGSSNPLVHSSDFTLNGDKTFTTEGITKNVIFGNELTVQARYPIYYGFAATAAALAVNANRYDPTISAVHTYTKTNDVDNQHFYILVPSDISALSVFTMGGAPFVMNQERTETIGGIVYKVYESAYTYNAGTTLKVSAS